MIKNNFFHFIRNIKQNKTTFFINLIGLSTGLACALLIYLWVSDELNFDEFHKKNTNLFQVMENQHNTNSIVTTNGTPSLLAESLATEMPEIKYAAYATDPTWHPKSTFSYKDKIFRADGKFASKDYFNVFTYELIQGDKNTLLLDKNSIVISQALAMKLFNTTENIISKTVKWQQGYRKNEVVISGVFKDIPPNTSDHFDFVLSYKLYDDQGLMATWGNYPVMTYVILKQDTNIKQLNDKIVNFVKSKYSNSNVTLFLKRYSEKYLYGKYENGVLVGGRIEYVKLFSLIAIFILLIACINFMNLSTARATRRTKEIGMKKALGAERKSLIFQHLGESMFMVLVSLFTALILVKISLPQFNEITGKHLSLIFDLNGILTIVGITLFTGAVSGSYPAFYLSSFNSITLLKGRINTSIAELWARKGLVVFQFTLSVILIVAVIVIYKQIEFVQTKNLGYEKDNIIYFDKDGRFTEDQNLESFLSEVKGMPEIINASTISHNLFKSGSYTTGVSWEGKDLKEIVQFENISVNYGIFKTLGIEMKEGRAFSRDFGSDNSTIILNEIAINTMGLKDPVGKEINLWGSSRIIVGVTKNFHFESLHENVKPAFFRLEPQYTKIIMVKVKAGMEKDAIKKLHNLYEKFNPGLSFNYKFLDDSSQTQYVAEKRVAVLSQFFAGLAILISCLGLFGLAAFSTERRFKEIGIRKVLGSTSLRIVYLLSSDFAILVFVSIIIALPFSYLITKNWLNEFAYRMQLEWWYFIGSGFISLIIAMLTVGSLAIKAANINPTKCLKDE